MGHQILCFEDSNTHDYNPRSYLVRHYLESVRWMGRLKAEGWEIFNEGENVRSIPRLDWGIGLTYEGVHFSKEGHKTFAKRMSETLVGILLKI